MDRFEIQFFSVCEVCLYLVTYGEYNDGEDTAEKKLKAWKESGFQHLIRYMSASCCGDGECGFTYTPCDLCGETGRSDHQLTALIPN